MAQSNEERAAKRKIRREKNKERDAEKAKIYYQTPDGKKSTTISNWKKRGLIDSHGDKYEKRYQSYLQSPHCEACKSGYKDSFDRCMDHDHDTGTYRQFLCRHCNRHDHWKTLI